jgi:DNA polymerase III alpha subunit (gram-positive type)
VASLYCCVDVEASGPVPGRYDLVSIGAVAVEKGRDGVHRITGAPFYAELQPQGGAHDPKAMAVHGITVEHLVAHGLPLQEALRRLGAWADALRGRRRPVFVGHNAPFDWAYLSHSYDVAGIPNPFGWKALDTKALAMGVLDLDWFDTNKEVLAELLPDLGAQDERLAHRADYDALYQARILCGLLNHPRRKDVAPRARRE